MMLSDMPELSPPSSYSPFKFIALLFEEHEAFVAETASLYHEDFKDYEQK
jgi:hypothetical protein